VVSNAPHCGWASECLGTSVVSRAVLLRARQRPGRTAGGYLTYGGVLDSWGCWASWNLEEDDSVWGRDQDKARRERRSKARGRLWERGVTSSLPLTWTIAA
jgi:hypothetical protein